MTITSKFGQALFDDQWEKWRKLRNLNYIKYLPHIGFIPVGLCGAFLFFVAAHLELSENNPIFLIIAGLLNVGVVCLATWGFVDKGSDMLVKK